MILIWFSFFCLFQFDIVAGIPQFDSLKVIEVLRTHNFTFPFWDPIHDSITISRTVDLTGEDLVAVARDICEEYTRGELSAIDDTAMLSCLSPTLMTLRKTKMHGISLLSRMFEPIPFDEEIYGLLVGYEGLYRKDRTVAEPSSSDASEEKRRRPDAREDMIFHVHKNGSLSPFRQFGKDDKEDHSSDGLTACVIGVPTAHTILPALFTKLISQVVVYSSVFDEVVEVEEEHGNGFNFATCPSKVSSYGIQRLRSESHEAIWNYFYANEIATQFNKTLYYHSMDDVLTRIDSSDEYDELSLCNIIQLNPDHEYEPLFANMTLLHRSLQILTGRCDETTAVDGEAISPTVIRLQHIVHTLENGTEVNNFLDMNSVETSSLWATLERDGLVSTALIQARCLTSVVYTADIKNPREELFQTTTDDFRNERFQVRTINFTNSHELEYNYQQQYELSVVSIGNLFPTSVIQTFDERYIMVSILN
jgi:hypothetical protein